MARPRTFDESEVIDAAVDAFWRGGLGATSIDALQDATGLARSSLYNSFGSKDEIVARSIERYAERRVAAVEQAFEGRSLHEALERMFLDIATDNNAGRGCLLVNSIGELHEPGVQTLLHVQAAFARLAARLTQLVSAARPDIEQPAVTATGIVCAVAGLRTLQRSGLPAEAVRETARRFARCIAAGC